MSSPPHPSVSAPPDAASMSLRGFLEILRRSGVLDGKGLQKIVARIRAGEYPRAPLALAKALVAGRVLTEYQARRLLHSEHPCLVLGRYAILERLGEGAMGRVYRARHRLMGRVVALKVVAPDVAARRSARARFRREMVLVGRLDHPGIVRAFDADEVNGIPYIVMEFLEGRTLDAVLRNDGPPAPADAIDWAVQAASALAHAHRRGVVHRDLKPSNLMVDGRGRLKILDFGVGALTKRLSDDPDADQTDDGLAIGTVEYMSPEQARGLEVDGRSDLYSLGCVLYHLLTGRVPFPGSNPVVCLARRIYDPPAPIIELRPTLPPGLAEAVARLTAPSPDDRYPDASAALVALRALSPALACPATDLHAAPLGMARPLRRVP